MPVDIVMIDGLSFQQRFNSLLMDFTSETHANNFMIFVKKAAVIGF